VLSASDVRGDKSVSISIKVRVRPTAVSISLEPKASYTEADPIEVFNTKAHSFKLRADVFPANSFDSSVIWESLSPAIKVDASGNISIAKDASAGVYTVRAITKDGGRIASRRIKINQGIRQIILSNPKTDENGGEGYVYIDKTIYLDVNIYPKDAYNKDLKVSVLEPSGEDYPEYNMVGVQYLKDSLKLKVEGLWASYHYDDKPAVVMVESTDGSNIHESYKLWVEYEAD